MSGLTYKSIRDIFHTSVTKQALLRAEKEARIPMSAREQRGRVAARKWEMKDVPVIGSKYGFLKGLGTSQVWTVFASKGGVFKTTLALNIARMAALHNIKTCVVGLDLQCDISRLMRAVQEEDEVVDLEKALAAYESQSGLVSLLGDQCTVQDLIVRDEFLPTLDVIPESIGLVHLDMALNSRFRKEMWLKENVTDPLKKSYDLIILDCPPSWSVTIANALVATDLLLSPLEVGISHFLSARSFIGFIERFRKELQISFDQIFVPTRYNPRRRLSQDICDWYVKNINNCTRSVIKDSSTGYDAIGQRRSVIEYAPRTDAAVEMRQLLEEIWERVEKNAQQKKLVA
jgi:chromosome partitioning protein